MYVEPNSTDKTIPAQAICMKCGSAQENIRTGFCKNDHDDWLEINDTIERFEEASKRFGLATFDIRHNIMKSIDCNVVDEIRNQEFVDKVSKVAENLEKHRESQTEHVVVSHEYLRKVMEHNNLQSTIEAEQLLIDVLAGTKTMKHE